MKRWKYAAIAVLVALVLIGGLVLALLARGFRATTEPSAVEMTVARALRNAAIPARERDAHNPLTLDAQNFQTGHDEFLARCSGCHGFDGSGRTPVGTSLYPRVPNLRSDLTQHLTDGQIHYFIENGIQLTGMPAWGTIYRRGADRSWNLVLFIRSLARASAAEDAALITTLQSAHYVGSQACESCHADIYRRWHATPMANIVRDPREHPDAIIPDLATNKVAPFSLSQVALVYGHLWKQRYFTKVGDSYYPLSAQWEVANHQWSKYMVPATGDWWVKYYPADNMQRPTGPTCDGCHSVGYDIQTKQVAEWNVGCERCHGPGSAHVVAPSARNIANPARMDYVAASDTCIQCHSQGQPLTNPINGQYYDWPVGYGVGLELQQFWRLETRSLGQTDFYYFPDGTAHKNRMQGNDFVQSVMYRRGVTCFDCHDVHGTGNYAQLRKPPETLCLDCHGPQSANGPRTATLEQHTHHPAGSPGSHCVACHMPAIESEGVPNTFVHAHTFRFVTPAMSAQYKIPNPCTGCHTDKTLEWASTALRQWTERSPWRMQ
jgi:predicted CXXCH cytochrome family protein